MKRVLAAWLVACGIAQAQPAQTGDEVPFITSPDNVTLEMLRLANVGANDHVIDLGSGDGRIVILAAKRFGASGLGVEIDPRLVELSQRNARDAGVADRAEFREQDLFKTDLSKASVVTMYLLPEVNLQLRPAILALKPGTRIVSHDWDMGDWKPDQTTVLPVPDKQVGLEKFSRVHLWVVPARVEGLWCGMDSRARRLQLKQKYQEAEVQADGAGGKLESRARLQGGRLLFDTTVAGEMELLVAGDSLVTTRGASIFRRARGTRC